MKKYLLIAGDEYYPSGGIMDWKGLFETREEIKIEVLSVKPPIYLINGERYEWFEIVDLERVLATGEIGEIDDIG